MIESAADFSRPRHALGTVVRVAGPHIVVSCTSPRGVKYVHQFARRNGVRIGGGHRADLVTLETTDSPTPERRRQRLQIDAPYREWSRHRGDLDRLRRLQEAIAECLEAELTDR